MQEIRNGLSKSKLLFRYSQSYPRSANNRRSSYWKYSFATPIPTLHDRGEERARGSLFLVLFSFLSYHLPRLLTFFFFFFFFKALVLLFFSFPSPLPFSFLFLSRFLYFYLLAHERVAHTVNTRACVRPGLPEASFLQNSSPRACSWEALYGVRDGNDQTNLSSNLFLARQRPP